MSDNGNGYTLLSLEASNFKKLRAVRITPAGEIVEIRGRNAQGKSSVLDAIEAALCGRHSIPARPVRGSESRAEIKLDFGNFVVRREIKPDGKHALKITSSDPGQTSNQEFLDELLGEISFDPYAFVRLKPREQAERLREALGIDTAELDASRKAAFEERTLVNREVQRLEGAIAEAPFPDGPDQPIDLTAELRELERIQVNNRIKERADADVARLRELASLADARVAALETALVEAKKQAGLAHGEVGGAVEAAHGIEVEDVAPVQGRIATAEQRNAVYRQRKARRDLGDQLAAKGGEAHELTARIEEIDEAKKQLLDTSRIAIPGLGLSEDAVTLNGQPLEQASQAERLRFAIALGLALNPKIRVLLIRDGSLLDEDSLRIVADMAREAKAQVWLERVGTEGRGVLIEDGEVVEEAVQS